MSNLINIATVAILGSSDHIWKVEAKQDRQQDDDCLEQNQGECDIKQVPWKMLNTFLLKMNKIEQK